METTEGEMSEVPDLERVNQGVEDTALRLSEVHQLRRTFGEEDWMRAQAGDQLHQLLGLEVSNLFTRGQKYEHCTFYDYLWLTATFFYLDQAWSRHWHYHCGSCQQSHEQHE